MNKIVFFDIDQTLFDRSDFMYFLYDDLSRNYGFSSSDIEKVKEMYVISKKEVGNFSPKHYLEKIYKNFPELSGKLEAHFGKENLSTCLYPDVVEGFKFFHEHGIFSIGIFSKGDPDYQRLKLFDLKEFIDRDKIYIFPNKIDKIPEVFEKYKDSEVYLVDDSIEVLEAVKRFNPKITTVQILREENQEEGNADFKIETLIDIIPIVNNAFN